MTDAEIFELRERNALRVKQAIAQMGKTYLCHPDNQVKRIPKSKQVEKNSFILKHHPKDVRR